MTTANWQLQTPASAIVFDCDGTLSTIEGIDELARFNGVYDEVAKLTAMAMGKTGLTPELYQQRLNLVNPRQAQLQQLAQTYLSHRIADAQQVIQTLKGLNKSVYIVSAGLNPAVTLFGETLQIPRENIYAVNLQFDQQGNYVDYDRTSPLVNNDGKRFIVSELKSQHEHIIHIGDGLNDYATHDFVTRFIGFGGIYYRENLAALCQYYISTASLASLLPLALTKAEQANLDGAELALYLQGVKAIEDKKVKCGA
jgi:phosphoserine phosphatase